MSGYTKCQCCSVRIWIEDEDDERICEDCNNENERYWQRVYDIRFEDNPNENKG